MKKDHTGSVNMLHERMYKDIKNLMQAHELKRIALITTSYVLFYDTYGDGVEQFECIQVRNEKGTLQVGDENGNWRDINLTGSVVACSIHTIYDNILEVLEKGMNKDIPEKCFMTEYKEVRDNVKCYEHATMEKVVKMLRGVGKPLLLGNTAYWICNDTLGNSVPAYCERSEYIKNRNMSLFMPIYDEFKTCEYGWSEFGDCCRIFDAIKKKINQTS